MKPFFMPENIIALNVIFFEVTLKDLKEKELPELNDDFAKQSGNKDSLKELKITE